MLRFVTYVWWSLWAVYKVLSCKIRCVGRVHCSVTTKFNGLHNDETMESRCAFVKKKYADVKLKQKLSLGKSIFLATCLSMYTFPLPVPPILCLCLNQAVSKTNKSKIQP